jgi:hypothetical protein
MPRRPLPSLTERLENPDAVLSRSDLRELGWDRRAVDAIFKALPVVHVPGYTRPHVRVGDYLPFIEEHAHGRGKIRLVRRSSGR